MLKIHKLARSVKSRLITQTGEFFGNVLDALKIVVTDAQGHIANVGVNGGLDINVQDQVTPPFDLYFRQQTGVTSTLATNILVDATVIPLVSAVGFNTGNCLCIFGNDRIYNARILEVNGNNVTVDTPVDFPFEAGSQAIENLIDLELANGSLENPEIYQIKNPSPIDSELSFDVTRILFEIITTDPPAFDEFGDIAGGLTNGIVLRKNNGAINNIFNAKTNGELANLMYDISFFDQTRPQGANGITARMTFAGQSKHGVAIRIKPQESLDLLIQDDLRTLLKFRIIAEGHFVQVD